MSVVVGFELEFVLMRIYFIIIFVCISLMPAVVRSQAIGNYVEDETDLYTSTKQVNQFFRRFNGEEDMKGERSLPGR